MIAWGALDKMHGVSFFYIVCRQCITIFQDFATVNQPLGGRRDVRIFFAREFVLQVARGRREWEGDGELLAAGRLDMKGDRGIFSTGCVGHCSDGAGQACNGWVVKV